MISIYHIFYVQLNLVAIAYSGLLFFSYPQIPPAFFSDEGLKKGKKVPVDVFPRLNALVITSPVLKASLPRCETFDTSSHCEFHKRITAAQYATPALLFFPI